RPRRSRRHSAGIVRRHRMVRSAPVRAACDRTRSRGPTADDPLCNRCRARFDAAHGRRHRRLPPRLWPQLASSPRCGGGGNRSGQRKGRCRMTTWGLLLSAVLFALGVAGLLARRNLLMILVSIEVMLNAAGLAFVAAGAAWNQADGQIMFLFILAVAA